MQGTEKKPRLTEDRVRKTSWVLLLAVSFVWAGGCTLRRNPLETPIISNSQQPDQDLFDRAMSDLEHSRYTVARLTLQTLINTYPDSEYIAKAKLAIADSWYREGGTSGLTQAEAEYRDFITFFPTMSEAGEAQMRVAMIHYRGMEKPDRDPTHARRAEQEFQRLLLNYPDAPFAPLAVQRLREVQEVLAQGMFEVARFYVIQGWDPAAQPRLKELIERYPNFSQGDTTLWLLGQSLERSGEASAGEAAPHYARIVRDYPLSAHVEGAKERLVALGTPIPDPDPVAVARMTYENTHGQPPGLLDKVMGAFHRRPNVTAAQGKTGIPTMTARGPAQAGAFSSSLEPAANAGTALPSSSPSQTILFESVSPAPASPPPAGSPSR